MSTPQMPSPKQQFLEMYRKECATTLRVLRALPAGKTDLKPHEMCKSAQELAWMFTVEQMMTEMAITTGLDFAKMASGPQMPATWDGVVQAFEHSHARLSEAVSAADDHKLMSGTVKFFTAPKTVGDIPTMQFLWMMLCDQIHHRGQFSIYLRMAGGKVPSIYGPTADEPWN